MFATAGVSKRIQFFNFRDVCEGTSSLSSPPDPHHRDATHSIATRSKLSCLSYNKHVRHHIASSDYEGVVTVWDVETKSVVVEFEEHDKRAWTVDYCRTDHRLLASGSDDGRVKIWSTAQEASVLELDVRANVCCAQYGHSSAHQLAVGCADHRVHLFDLRNPSEALAVLSGHRKAVSYVRFLPGGDELASASTDNTLCVWDIRGGVIDAAKGGVAGGSTGWGGFWGAGAGVGASAAAAGGTAGGLKPAAVLEGHTNEKNFVGLSVGAGDLIACGSETNEVFVYHKSFTSPLVKYNFGDTTNAAPVVAQWHEGAADGAGIGGAVGSGFAGYGGGAAGGGGGPLGVSRRPAGSGGAGDGGAPVACAATSNGADTAAQARFISATCWRGDDPILLAANSQGSIKVLQLVE